MTTPVDQTTPTDVPPPGDDTPPEPYANGASYELTKPYDLAQLLDEIRAALKRSVEGSVSGPDDPSRDPAPDNVATLSITPGDVDHNEVEQVIAHHTPTPGYEVPDHERAYRAVMQAVVDDPEGVLSAEQVEVAVRGLLLRSTMGTTELPAAQA